MKESQVDDELEGMWKKATVAYLRYYRGICLEGLNKTTKNLRQDSRSPGDPLLLLVREVPGTSPKPGSPD
jgi:hypothetical protein